MEVGFLLADGTIRKIEYYDIDKYCMELCRKEEYLEEFQKFTRQYHYFHPYFDFVTQKLGHIFLNPLMIENTALIFRDGAYYLVENNGEEYAELVKKETIIEGGFAFMTACSDKELKIAPATIFEQKDAVIDPNKVRMMSYTGTPQGKGSHTTTCNTILNQILNSNEEVVDHVQKQDRSYLHYSLLYLARYLGFLHYDAKQKSVLGNRENLTPLLESFIHDGEEVAGMTFIDYDEVNRIHFSDHYSDTFHFRR